MRVLVAYGSKRGGTRGIAETIGAVLGERGLTADVVAAEAAPPPSGYDAVIVGGALYTMRWRRSARRYVKRNLEALRHTPTWLFSSGPLDDSATQREIPPVRQVRSLMDRAGAEGHVTFGGRLAADAKGFPAATMAKKNAGDWRDPEQIRRWASGIADSLAATRPAEA